MYVDPTRLPENIQYKDIISGENRETTMDGLMDQGIQTGVKMVESAYDYYCGNISRQVCEKTIAGNNLDTGQIGKTRAISTNRQSSIPALPASFQSAKAARYFSLYSLRVDTK